MIDDRGRLFGAINLLDALLLLFVLGLVPLGYTAYRVFRVPPPRIERVEPASQLLKPDARVRLIGHDMRPYLRVWINKAGQPLSVTQDNLGANEAHLLIQTPTLAEMQLPRDLTPGAYDIHVFDGSREIASMPSAFSLEAPVAEVEVVARFPVDEAAVALVHAGDRDLVAPGSPRFPSTVGYAHIVSVRTLEKPVTMFAINTLRVGTQMPARMLEAVVSVPVTKTEDQVLEYRRQAVRVGDPLQFDTAAYIMYGVIVEVRTPGATSK
jgi:hypothetical protein